MTTLTDKEELIERAKALLAQAVGCPVKSEREVDLSDKDQVFVEDALTAIVEALTSSPHQVTAEKLEGWQPIEEMCWPIEQPIIVTDGLSVYGAGWWHPGEQAWLDCGGITPTHWQPPPDPPKINGSEQG